MNANKQIHWSKLFRSSAALPGVFALAGVCLVPVGRGAEHPEHPTKATKKAEAKTDVTLEDVAKYIESHVAEQSKNGVYSINDKAPGGGKLALTLDRVHRERLSQVGPDMFFVCADFKTADGGKIYDLDFFVQGASKENLKVLPAKTSVHKEDGKERYTWALNEKTGNWEQKPIGATPAAESGKKAEHPEHPQ